MKKHNVHKVGGFGPHPDRTVPHMPKSGEGNRKAGVSMNPVAVPQRDYNSGHLTAPEHMGKRDE